MVTPLRPIYRLIVLLLFFTSFAHGLDVDRAFTRVPLKSVCQAFAAEKLAEITPEMATSTLQSDHWQSCSDFNLARGYSKQSLWLKFDLNNTDNITLSTALDLYVAWLADVRIFQFQNDKFLQEIRTGIMYPFYDRAIPTPNVMLSLDLEPNEHRTLVLNISGNESMIVGGFIHSEESAYKQQIIVQLINGGLIFSISLLTLYNLFLFFSLRDINYLYYVGYSSSMLFLTGVIYGFNYQLAWPNSPQWNFFTYAASGQFTAIFIVLFVRSFLNTEVVSKTLDRVLLAFLFASVFLLGLCIPEETRSFAIQFSGPLATAGGPAVLAVGIVAWWRGYTGARYFTLAWSASLISITIFGVMVMGVIEFNFWLYYSFAIGVLIEITLISLALADKYHMLRIQKDEADSVALAAERELAKTLKKSAEELEYKVRVRTADLRHAKVVAENLARTDELTGMSNRRAYFELGEQVHQRAKNKECVYSIVMLDIDKFKNVNDTYGHASGDLVIIDIANVLAKLLPDDAIAGRIGGEEFGIILPAYALDTVEDVAEAMREAVEARSVSLNNNKELKVTISLGIAEYRDGDISLDEVMARADIGLYEAKETGRNRVCIYLNSTVEE